MIYAQEERRRKVFEIVVAVIGIAAVIALLSFFVWLVGFDKGYWGNPFK